MGLPRTFVGFGSKDIHYYRLMCAWKEHENIDFNFVNCQLSREISSEDEAYIKKGAQKANASQRLIPEQFKQCLVEIKMTVIETQLRLLEMQRELVTSHAMKLRQPMFGMAPKRLDAVNVCLQPLTNSLLP